MTTTPFQFGKEYRTRDGRTVRVTRISDDGLYPIRGRFIGESWEYGWRADGSFYPDGDEHRSDLIPPTPAPPETETWWLNRYESGSVSLHSTAEAARLASTDQMFRGAVLIDCIPVQLPPLPKPRCDKCGREMP